MEETDKKRFAELIAGLAQTFLTDVSIIDIENYWLFLRGYSIADMELAIVNFCTSPEGNRFMPKPGELIAALEGNATQQAQQAWTKIINAIRQIGGDATVVFDDPLIHSVLRDMGGWIRLCGMYSKDEPFKQREFESRYVAYRRNPPKEYPRKLIGRMDAGNSLLGYSINKVPILIGDEKKASTVYLKGQEAAKLSLYKPLSLIHLEPPQSSNGGKTHESQN
jgi:hypothetical protein